MMRKDTQHPPQTISLKVQGRETTYCRVGAPQFGVYAYKVEGWEPSSDAMHPRVWFDEATGEWLASLDGDFEAHGRTAQGAINVLMMATAAFANEEVAG